MKSKLHRTGPHPLWLHLNAGAAMMAAAVEGDDMLSASQTMLQKSMDGVDAYHNSQVQSFRRSMDVLAHQNGTRILHYKNWKGKKYVLLIPSLINSWRIFDIEKEHSFMNYLNNQGLTPLIVDWVQPKENITLDEYIAHHLKPLIDKIDNIQGMIGYCMGGTIIAALYSLYPELKQKVAKSVLIAPPWDFSYQTPEQILRLQGLALQTYAMGNIAPNDFVQSLFWAIDPLQVFKKFQKFPHIKNPHRFVMVEDWLNEGRAVSTSVIQTCLLDWYRDNNMKWDDKNLPTQTMIVTGTKDNLVPLQSSQPLIKNRKAIFVDTGHIGLMASDKSVRQAWKPIADFLKKDTVIKRKKS